MLNPDYRDMLSAFAEAGVDYLLVGAYALAAHGHPRATGDMDLWVCPSAENAPRVMRALRSFGAPSTTITQSDFKQEDVVFQIGVSPRRIDILTSIEGVTFAEAWNARAEVKIEGLSVPVLNRTHFIQNKRTLGRTQDLADIERLESEEPGEAE